MRGKLKVLFIFKSENFLAPLGLCAISAAAKRGGHESCLCEINSQDPIRAISRLKPDVVAYSASTGEAKHYLSLNDSIKAGFPDIFTIMGGPHATFFPELLTTSSLDAVCVGEGEDAFSELLNALENGISFNNIPNIIVKRGLGVKKDVRPLIEDIDTLPFPDYGLLYDNTPMGRYPLKNFITSRGCPYNCTYCFNPAWRRIYHGKGKSVRRHSVDYVIEDINRVKGKWPLSSVKFYDDIFVYEADDWLREFSEKYKKYIGLPFFILTRADLLTEDVVKMLKAAGCRTISMSIEAGNSDIRNKVLKRNMSNEQIVSAHRLCEKYGIYTFTNCILGLPFASLDNEIESLDLSLKCRVSWCEFVIFHPYPKTVLGDEAVSLQLYKPEYDKMHTSYMHSSPLNCFSPMEKNIHRNLSVLGPAVVALPGLRDLVVKRLIYWKHNSLFTILYYLVKMYILRNKIYVTKTNVWNSILIFVKSLKQEFFRHEKKDKAEQKPSELSR